MPHHSILIQLPISTHVDAVTLTLDNLKRKLLHIYKDADMISVEELILLQRLIDRLPNEHIALSKIVSAFEHREV